MCRNLLVLIIGHLLIGSFLMMLINSRYLERAVLAAENVVMPTDGGGSASEHCTQFELDSFNLTSMAKIVMSWNPADAVKYGERIGLVATTEAGTSRPILLASCFLVCEWFFAFLAGDTQGFVAAIWKITKMNFDMNDARTDAYQQLTEEERYLVKPNGLSFIYMSGDAMMRIPGFSLDIYGPNGDTVVECAEAYNYTDHHTYLAAIYSVDTYLVYSGADWLLTLQYGRVSESIRDLEKRLPLWERAAADIFSPTRIVDVAFCLPNMCVTNHIHGRPNAITKVIDILGFTFDSLSDYLSELTKESTLYSSMEQKGPGGGIFSLKRMLWHVQSFMVMHTDMPASKAIAWLESLPDNEGFYQVSMTLPTHDGGAFHGGSHHTCWLALAHEKVGLHDGALRFCRLALEPDMLKAGVPHIKWTQVVAFACKGRVLTKLNRHIEALDAYQAAITTAKQSYPMMEALAYRELANCDTSAAGCLAPMRAAAAQAARDLEEKLKEFDGRLTRAEFDTLTIAPPSTPDTVTPSNLVVPAAPVTSALLPDGKHAFLSYQWDVQVQVVQIKALLNERNVKCWMDIDGGMKSNIYDSVSTLSAAS
jgi:hypothetical protein